MRQVIAIAYSAGIAIMKIYHSGEMGKTSKADNSPLTLADMAAHKTIVDGLSRLSPKIPILSEEATTTTFSERSQWTKFWLVDPLDGTKEFIKRNGEFTVNIALIENGKPILGVVYAPALNVCYYGKHGTGSFVQHGNHPAQPISANPHLKHEPIRVVTSRSHSDARTETFLNQLGEHQCISMGSSLKLCLVAEGAAHLYPRLGPTMEWDTAAAHAVVNSAGGMVCNLNGEVLCYNKADLHNPEFLVLPTTDEVLFDILKISKPQGIWNN